MYITETDKGFQTQGSTDKSFLYKDHLGSTDVITGKTGTVLQSMSFDAWGQRRDGQTWDLIGDVAKHAFDTDTTNRGYTGHEQLDEVGLIHMNGRVYDPKLARFLQADPFIQAADNTQSYNRYSYVWNNPLNATDPSGFILSFIAASRIDAYVSRPVFEVLGRNSSLASLVQVAGTVVSTYFCGPCSIGFSAQFSKNLAYAQTGSFNSAYRAATISGATAAAFYGIGELYGGNAISFEEKVFLHAMVGGAASELQGGDFVSGFAAAGFTALLSRGSTSPGTGITAASVAKAALVGGTASAITGGKFANGAVTGAMSYALNESLHAQKRRIATDPDPVVRVLKTLKAYGRMAAGGLQVAAGKGMCATVALCSVGAPLAAQGTGNLGGGVSDYLEVLGYKTNLNITQQGYEAMSPGNGQRIFLSVDVATGVAGLAAGLRQVPVAIDRGMTVTQYTTVSAYRVEGTTAPAIFNDILQATNSANGLNDL